MLGVGGMGVVFRARHLGLNRVVALKMALAGGYARPGERACLQREARAVAALRHPNVVQVYDVGDSGGRPYFTMEYVEGGSLAQKLAGTPLPAGEAGGLVAALATAVEAAHRAGVVHRDLKPANVLLTSDGVPKVSDFGLARRLAGEAGLSRTGIAVGTPSYMAPEQAQGKADAAGPAADVYALGAILYEVLTGRPPFRAETAAETIRQVLDQDPVPPSRLNGRVPRDLETICLKCLQKEPGLRYAAAAALADDLGRFLRGDVIAARPEGLAARLMRRVRRRPAFWATAAAGTLVAIVLAGGSLWLLADRAAASRAVAAAEAAVEQAADDDLGEMAGFVGRSSWPEARAALERAKGRVGERGSSALRARLDQAGRDLELVARLDSIRLDGNVRAGQVLDFTPADRAYEEAFSGSGLGRVLDEVAGVAARVAASNARNALVAALDHWSSCAQDPSRRGWVARVADLAADDAAGWRARARNPEVWQDEAALTRIIESAPPAAHSVPLLLALELSSSADGKVKVRFLRRVQQANSSDFWANQRLGDVLSYVSLPADAVGYYRAALATRPGAAIVRNNLAAALNALGRSDECLEEYRLAVRLDPSAVPVYCNFADTLWNQKRQGESVELLREGIRLNPAADKLHAALARRLEVAEQFAAAVTHFQRAVALDPKDHEAGQALRKLLVRLGRWDEAQDAWRRSLDGGPAEHDAWDGYAELCLFLGMRDEYQRAAGALLDRFEAVAEAQVAERTGRACLMASLPPGQAARAAALIDRALADEKKSPEWVRPYYLFAKGMAEYRLGHLEKSIALVRGEASGVFGPAPGLILAMAQHKRGQAADARKTLARAVLSHDWRASEVNSREGWIYHILRREAESLILPDLTAFLDGKHEPRDDERLALLGACQFSGHSLAQARLYADAFAADPLLADDLRAGHRYRAARAAAMTGCGRGADATRLGESERTRWRTQARAWLRADLAAWGQALDSDPAAARGRACQQLTQWRTDRDFAELRESAELGKLPVDEQKDCLALWAELGVVLDRCAIAK